MTAHKLKTFKIREKKKHKESQHSDTIEIAKLVLVTPGFQEKKSFLIYLSYYSVLSKSQSRKTKTQQY